jgi:hypothetical protein
MSEPAFATSLHGWVIRRWQFISGFIFRRKLSSLVIPILIALSPNRSQSANKAGQLDIGSLWGRLVVQMYFTILAQYLAILLVLEVLLGSRALIERKIF